MCLCTLYEECPTYVSQRSSILWVTCTIVVEHGDPHKNIYSKYSISSCVIVWSYDVGVDSNAYTPFRIEWCVFDHLVKWEDYISMNLEHEGNKMKNNVWKPR